MEDLKKHHQKCKVTYTVCDENDKPLNVDVFNYDQPNEYMPIVLKALEELTKKNIELEKKIKILETNVSTVVPSNKINITQSVPSPPIEENHTFSRVKKPINLKL